MIEGIDKPGILHELSTKAKLSDGYDNDAWNSYSPTVTAQTGALTSYTADGYYKQSGKTVNMTF